MTATPAIGSNLLQLATKNATTSSFSDQLERPKDRKAMSGDLFSILNHRRRFAAANVLAGKNLHHAVILYLPALTSV